MIRKGAGEKAQLNRFFAWEKDENQFGAVYEVFLLLIRLATKLLTAAS